MKLVNRGIYKGEEQLPVGKLPEDAVLFKEPENAAKLNLAALAFAIPAFVLAFVFIAAVSLLRNPPAEEIPEITYLPALLLAFLTIVPHELLHGVCFGRDAEVELFFAPRQGMAFVVCTKPVTKARFIFMSLCPNLVFGWLPLLAWAVFPVSVGAAKWVCSFSMLCILFGSGDYLNVWNALRQMPRGSLQQMSGFHSYWFMPKKQGEGHHGGREQ